MLQIVLDDKQYRAFIKFAVKTCDSFSLVFEKDVADKSKYVFQEFYSAIAEFVLIKNSIDKHPDTGTSFQFSEINCFACNKHTSSVLQTAERVFDWDGENQPEELCFYRQGKKWFVFICHEKYLFIYDETNEDIAFLEKEGIEYWHEV